MSKQLTAEDAKQSLNAHVAAKGAEILDKYGPAIGWRGLLTLLEDRACVRYPCSILFDAAPLQQGEFAFVSSRGERPEDGFNIFVHPYFMTQLDRVPALVFYHLVVVNYGPFASADDAETFGAYALGIKKEDYYQMLCALADELAGGSGGC